MKWLKYFCLVLCLLQGLQLSIFAGSTQPKQTKLTTLKQTCFCSVDTVKVPDCVFDTIRLAGRGKTYKGKRYYYTDKECYVVELKPQNKNPIGFGTIVRFLIKILKV
jgi:hypothetical protein